MAALGQIGSDLVARATGAEAGMVVASASAGLVLATAGCVARGDPRRSEELPHSSPPNEVVVLRAHVVHWGMSVRQAISLGGGRMVEVGDVNRVSRTQLAAALGPETAALLYVVSHHVNPEGSLPLSEVLDMAHERHAPVIVDAAAEMDLKVYVGLGAELVVYSGQKAIGGPTSGLLVGKSAYVEMARAQLGGIGRAMKVSKEATIGLLTALDLYTHRDEAAGQAEEQARVRRLVHLLGTIPGGRVDVVGDETRPIERVRLRLGTDAPLSAVELVQALEEGSPSIRTRNHHVGEGIILFDPRTLKDGEEATIAQAVRAALGL
jgi:L-seryl-tRNA(Ser) seleniumtransferase/D-glucosaminate-6-phosphate ammonia-lyase